MLLPWRPGCVLDQHEAIGTLLRFTMFYLGLMLLVSFRASPITLM